MASSCRVAAAGGPRDDTMRRKRGDYTYEGVITACLLLGLIHSSSSQGILRSCRNRAEGGDACEKRSGHWWQDA